MIKILGALAVIGAVVVLKKVDDGMKEVKSSALMMVPAVAQRVGSYSAARAKIPFLGAL